jgi:hypothetical protein
MGTKRVAVAEATEDDPEAAAAEWLGQFRSDLESYISTAVLDACTTLGVVERPVVPGLAYVGFIDAAAGSGRDSFAAAIARRPPSRRPSGRSARCRVRGETPVRPGPTMPGVVRCCVPENDDAQGDENQQGDAGECEQLTAMECSAEDGTAIGPGSCEPNPCPVTSPSGAFLE